MQTELIDQLARRTTFGYDEVGRQQWRLDAKGQRTTYVYDDAGRPIRWEYSDGSRATFTYDAVGSRLTMEDGTGLTTYSYDNVRRPETVTYPGNKTITYAYDAVGNRQTMTNPDGGVTTYSFDARNQAEWLENPFNERSTFVYDAANKAVSQQNANGTWVSYTYDDAGSLTQLVNLKSDNTTLSSFAYSLDDVGNRIGVTEANGDIVTWSYDNAYQLTREQRNGANTYDITYTYDPVGNRLTKVEGGATTTYAYDAANQIQTEETPSQITTFTFDANGNTQVENAGGELTTYTWNIENMCTGIALPAGTLNTFAYDADLVRRQAEDSDGLVKFINDMQNVLAETDSGGTTQVAYTLDPQLYGNLISQRRSGATSWHLFDALGSTERLTDSSEAAQVQYLHKAFGLTSVLSGSSPNRHTWIGRLGYRWEPDAELHDVRRRKYKATRGRWESKDPDMIGRSVNSYLYSWNNPANRLDPTGLKCRPISIASIPVTSGIKAGISVTDRGVYDGVDFLGSRFMARGQMDIAAQLICDCYGEKHNKRFFQWYQGWWKDGSGLGQTWTTETADTNAGWPYPTSGQEWILLEDGTYKVILRTRDIPGVHRGFVGVSKAAAKRAQQIISVYQRLFVVGSYEALIYFRTCLGEWDSIQGNITQIDLCTYWGYHAKIDSPQPNTIGIWDWLSR